NGASQTRFHVRHTCTVSTRTTTTSTMPVHFSRRVTCRTTPGLLKKHAPPHGGTHPPREEQIYVCNPSGWVRCANAQRTVDSNLKSRQLRSVGLTSPNPFRRVQGHDPYHPGVVSG